MNVNTLTIKAQELLQSAIATARQHKQQALEPLHILDAAIADDNSVASYLIGRVGGNLQSIRREVAEAIKHLPRVEAADDNIYFSRETSALIQRAVDITTKLSDRYASVEHLIAAMAHERSAARDILRREGISEEQLL